jgi:DnaJ-class molecular chaperone
VRAQQGFFTIERTCPACHGAGQVIDKPCRSCEGAGRVHREKSLQVNIPAGVEDGTRIRLAGEGEAGMRGGLRAISTSSSRSRRTACSSATAPTSTAACRSR